MIAYHATPVARLSRILAQGLLIGMPRIWSDASGRKQGSRRHLHFCLDEDAAVRWAYKMQYDLGQPCAVLTVDLGEAATEPDPHPEGQLAGYRWIRTQDGVPRERIDGAVALTPARIRAVVARLAEAA